MKTSQYKGSIRCELHNSGSKKEEVSIRINSVVFEAKRRKSA